MGLFDSTDKLQKWVYHVTELNLTIPGEASIKIPSERLVGMSLTENYEGLYFPLLKITLVLDSTSYYKIKEHKNDCKLRLRVDKCFHGIDSNEKSLYRPFINNNFSIVVDDATDDMNSSQKLEEYKNNFKKLKKDTTYELEEINNAASFYLFMTDTLDGTRLNDNHVLCNCNIADAIAYLFTKGKISNLIMAQPDNTKVYENIVLPNDKIIKNLQFLDTYYGIYKVGTIIYFGFLYSYIIPYNGECNAYPTDEKKDTVIVIPSSSNAQHSTNLGSLNKGSNQTADYIIGDYRTIGVDNDSISNNYIASNDVQTVDSLTGKSTIANSNAVSRGKNFVEVVENKTENEFLASIKAAQNKAKSMVVKVNLQDYNISAIAPNKRFKVFCEDTNLTKKYAGNYIAANVTHNFILQGEDFLLNSILVLRKA